jgi:hypothetical protein
VTVTTALLLVIGILCLLLAGSFIVIWRLVVHLSDKIAIPLYDAAAKRTIIARPEPVTKARSNTEDENMGPKQTDEQTNYQELDELEPGDLHSAIVEENR